MSEQKDRPRYRIGAKSGATPSEAGFGLVHADTIVATTEDELTITPSAAQLRLRVGARETSGSIAALGLGPGEHDGFLQILDGKSAPADRKIKLLLIEPSAVCRKFGARYGSLEYGLPVVTGKGKPANWNSLWKTGEFADIVVDFDQPYKFTLWRGMSYAPSWAMNNVMTSLFFAETLDPGVFRDCCEMMSDRECRYSHARIIHSSAARVVIHWRSALADTAYNICRNQWSDEVFYIYPDGAAVRNVTIYVDPGDPLAWQTLPQTGQKVPRHMINGGGHGFNNMEFIAVNPPGATSADNIPPEALTLLDTGEFSRTFRWPDVSGAGDLSELGLKDYIFRLNYRHRPGVFIASPPDRMRALLVPNRSVRYVAGAVVQDDRWERVPDQPTDFADQVHWPITRGYGTTPLTDPAEYLDRPTHTFLGWAANAPVEVRENGAATWSWFSGIAPEDDRLLRNRAGSWLHPARIDGCRYDSRQGAYVADTPGPWFSLTVAEQPAIRPTFVLPGREDAEVSVKVNDVPFEKVSRGVERSLAGTRLVITFSENLAPGSKVVFG